MPVYEFESSVLCRQLGCDYPIFGFSHSEAVVAAVSNAGGVGIWGATRSTPQEIRDGLKRIRAAIGIRPFGVDLVLPKGMPDKDDRAAMEALIPEEHRRFISGLREKYAVPADGQSGMRSRFVRSEEMAERQLQEILASDVDVFAMGVGSPESAIVRAKERGKRVVALVGTPTHAQRAIDAGAELIVAQGYDAGAHTGEIGTFSLVPQVVDVAGSVPVIAAGGVATGRHIAASLALGAVGVWIGTAWLFSEEESVHPIVFEKLRAAGSADTVRSRADSGKTLRQIRTSWTAEWEADGAPVPLRMPLQDIVVGDFLGAVDRAEIKELMHTPAGQSVAYFSERSPVADIMRDLVTQTRDALT